MLYVILDTLLEVVFNTNNTGHHAIHDMLLKVVFNTNKAGHSVLLVFNTTFNNMSVVTYNMVTI
jgi:hypothetical protein